MELNKVDQHIKQMMLSCPALFKSRMSALNHLFMTNGNGYEWDENGCLALLWAKPSVGKMDDSDLIERQAELDQERADDTSGVLSRIYAARQAALARDVAERQLIAADIDLYASEHVMGEDIRYGVEWMKHFDPHYCALRDAPYASLDRDWAAAAEETLLVAQGAISRHLGMHSQRFSREQAEPHWLGMYDAIEEILDKLDATTGRKAAIARKKDYLKALFLAEDVA